MAKAVKLPSGSYRTVANKTIDGKVVRKSFTVSPKECHNDARQAKAQSEKLAREWVLSHDDYKINGPTVKNAIDSYIEDKSKVLSPSTIRGYKLILDTFHEIWDIYITDIDTALLQRIVNEWSVDFKTKTIRNRVNFLLSVLDYNEIYKKFKIKYPQNNSKKVESPDIEDVKLLIKNADKEMKPIIYLAALGSLRRGEIGGLRGIDVKKDKITINGDMVLSENGYVYKPFPKTEGSVRTIQLPKFVIKTLPIKEDPNDFLFDLTPTAMTDRFRRLAKRLGLTCTLHSLRHFAASFRTDLGIPQKYVEEVGGWTNDSVTLKRVYDNKLDSSRKKYTELANKYMEDNFK